MFADTVKSLYQISKSGIGQNDLNLQEHLILFIFLTKEQVFDLLKLFNIEIDFEMIIFPTSDFLKIKIKELFILSDLGKYVYYIECRDINVLQLIYQYIDRFQKLPLMLKTTDEMFEDIDLDSDIVNKLNGYLKTNTDLFLDFILSEEQDCSVINELKVLINKYNLAYLINRMDNISRDEYSDNNKESIDYCLLLKQNQLSLISSVLSTETVKLICKNGIPIQNETRFNHNTFEINEI